MGSSQENQKIKELLTRSIDKIYPNYSALESALKSGKKLRVYMGIDPTADYAHLGHSTNYIILKRFHELGHKIIVLIGDFTAMIGDPSDKSSARIHLTKEQVNENLKTFKSQIGKILDFNDKNNPIEFKFNSAWLSKMNFEDLISLASHFTVQQMIERDNFEKRLHDNKPLYVHEFFYPLMQGYDSVALEADVEIGGTDQTFNMLAGRALVKSYLKREKFVVSTTLLENPVTREKLMSKSMGTGIGLNEDSKNMYGKTMALPDEAIIQCFIDCTYLSLAEIDKLDQVLKNGVNPRDIKAKLAHEITSMYHGKDSADKAEAEFINQYKNKNLPDDISEVTLSGTYDLLLLINNIGFGKSNAEIRRLISQGAVKIDGAKITDEKTLIATNQGMIVQIGKRNYWKIKQ